MVRTSPSPPATPVQIPLFAAQACLAFAFCAAAVALFPTRPFWATWFGAGLLLSAPLVWLVMRERPAEDDEDRPRLLIPAARPILIAAMVIAAVAGLSRTREFVYKKPDDFAPAVLGVISIGCGIYAMTSLDRRRIAQGDAWRATRRSTRAPQLVEAEQRDLAERLSTTTARATRAGPRVRVDVRPESGVERFLERAFVVYLGVGLIFALPFGALGLIVYATIAHTWLALLDRLESRRFDGPRLPAADSELRKAVVKIRKARGFLAASPPASLRRMRIAFSVLAILVVAFGTSQLVLDNVVPDGAGALLGLFPGCLALGALWQWWSESSQARDERAWLARQETGEARST